VRYKTYLILAALIVVLLWLNLTRPAFINRIRPNIVNLLEFPLKAATSSARGVYGLATFQNRYENKISLLEQKLAVLSRANVQMKELFNENERLRNLLSFKDRFASKTVAAEVIARGQTGWDTFIIIDKGAANGIDADMSVAKSDGLIGRVFEVGPGSAKIMLIDNPTSRVSVAVQRTREQGVLVGLGGGLCKLIYLSYDTDVKPGDIVITSELSSLATKGIPIGEVIKVVKEPRSLYASAIVKPSSNLFKIEEVLCIE
jgi:rod shape-determining protein MreC